jgi:hypothetical protein
MAFDCPLMSYLAVAVSSECSIIGGCVLPDLPSARHQKCLALEAAGLAVAPPYSRRADRPSATVRKIRLRLDAWLAQYDYISHRIISRDIHVIVFEAKFSGQANGLTAAVLEKFCDTRLALRLPERLF